MNFNIKNITDQNLLAIIVLVFFVCCHTNTYAQGFLKAEGKIIINDESGEEVLLKGMGLGGWMVQEGYMLQTASFANPQHQIKERIQDVIGEENTNLFYDAWLSNHVTEADIIALKEWGFNSVRLPMHYNLFTLPIQEEPIVGENTWLDKGFELTDNLLEWCKNHEMYVILDLHAAPGGQGKDEGISDYDPSLPSLWESALNQDKTVALWRRIAEHYKDEPWIGGYDLINETNWPMTNNFQLRSIYERITETIREVDQRHIIFIEGNWFANDFSGLTPPWDNNMVYSPHKYWSINDQESIQWVLDMREQFDVPLYLGETGENSNVWFKDAVKLFADNNIGWAWWPMKKIESIAGPLSVEKTEGYSRLLDYWSGVGSKPSMEESFATLMDITDKLKFENCRFQPDMIDALFRQQETTETLPFVDHSVPGVIFATDFDLGYVGYAYSDREIANFQVSTSVFTSWNNGWAYRNDGVDIEICEDNVNTNGFNVGWIDEDEWMKYTVNVTSEGVYDVHLRVASSNNNGRIAIEVDESSTDPFPVPNTGDFQNWETMIIPDVILSEGTQEIIIRAVSDGFNLSSMDFQYQGSAGSIAFTPSSGKTIDKSSAEVSLNKSVNTETSLLSIADFSITINGQLATINNINLSNDSKRKLIVELEEKILAGQSILFSYNGSSITATDNSQLANFQDLRIINLIEPSLQIPGKIEAEDYFEAEGIELENTTDSGGGQNIGFLDQGDYLDYDVEVIQSGEYVVHYRVASENTEGGIRLNFIDEDGNTLVIDQPDFPVTGGWQTWSTVESGVELEAGNYVMRIEILDAPFNMNWIEFESIQVIEDPAFGVFLYPNPTSGLLGLDASFSTPHAITYTVFNAIGESILRVERAFTDNYNGLIDLSLYPAGIYFIVIELEDGTHYDFKIMVE